jgi:hypothetical protein
MGNKFTSENNLYLTVEYFKDNVHWYPQVVGALLVLDEFLSEVTLTAVLSV